MKKLYLIKERNLQAKIILQLNSSAKLQTKPYCSMGHHQCKINHQKYNIVRYNSVKYTAKVFNPC